eukprot:m.9865 g.9865  ORF g.9865 m.9865 type:complete len:72 (+) comp4154_c0_seq1:180-395(+)
MYCKQWGLFHKSDDRLAQVPNNRYGLCLAQLCKYVTKVLFLLLLLNELFEILLEKRNVTALYQTFDVPMDK